MNKFVAIKCYGQMVTDDPSNEMAAEMPADYPAQCREFETKEQAEAECPGWRVMSIESYEGFKAALDLVYSQKVAELQAKYSDPASAPWWKFW